MAAQAAVVAEVESEVEAEAKSWSVRRRLSPETVSEIVRRYEGGVGTPQLCREYRLSKYSILKLLHGRGVRMRRQPLTESQRRNAVRLYQDGETIDAIAEQLQASYSRIRETIIDAGVPLNRPDFRSVLQARMELDEQEVLAGDA